MHSAAFPPNFATSYPKGPPLGLSCHSVFSPGKPYCAAKPTKPNGRRPLKAMSHLKLNMTKLYSLRNVPVDLLHRVGSCTHRGVQRRRHTHRCYAVTNDKRRTGVRVTIPRQSRGPYNLSRSKRLFGGRWRSPQLVRGWKCGLHPLA